ncbi:MAG: ParA family protein [Anaerolineales bacterium]|nr:ParA family protein [Anaerolineales bacterium]
MARVLAISNQKGGVAKTTTCLSLGASLAAAGQQVLVVDLDSQANLTMAAGFDPDQLDETIVDLLMAEIEELPYDLDMILCTTTVEGLQLLPADVRLAGLERRLYEYPGYEYLLKKILHKKNPDYDMILLDCPPSLSALTLMALSTADEVLIPAQCEYYAAKGLERLLEIVEAVREKTNPALSAAILPTMYDQRNRICRMVLNQLQQGFPEMVLDHLIGIDTKLREAPALGEPITVYAPNTRAAEQYNALAAEILENHKNTRKVV